MKRLLITGFFCGLCVSAVSLFVSAEPPTDAETGACRLESGKIKIALETGYYHIFGIVQAAENRETDELLNLTGDLGVKRMALGGNLSFSYALGQSKRQFLTLSHFQISSGGEARLEKNAEFNGETFFSGEKVRGRFSFSDIKSFYSYRICYQGNTKPRFSLDLMGGLDIVYINTRIASSQAELHIKKHATDEEFNTVNVLLGLDAVFELSDNLSLESKMAQTIPTGLFTDKGDTAEFDLKLNWYLNQSSSLNIGYKSVFTHFHFRGDEGGGDFAENTADGSIRGISLGATVSF